MQIADDIFYLRIESNGSGGLAVVTHPSLSLEPGAVFAKVVYSSVRFDGSNGPGMTDQAGRVWFKTTIRQQGGRAQSVSDDEIQSRAAELLGLGSGHGANRGLSRVEWDRVAEIIRPPRLIDARPEGTSRHLAALLGGFYGVAPEDIRLIGGLALFPIAMMEAHDVDVVVPIRSREQAAEIATNPRPCGHCPVYEYGIRWPLRWRDEQTGLLVCPFFIYDGLDQPIQAVRRTNRSFRGEVQVLDATHGIFSVPVLETQGDANLIALRTTLARGQQNPGTVLAIDGPIYMIETGTLRGNEAVLVTDLDTQVRAVAKDDTNGI